MTLSEMIKIFGNVRTDAVQVLGISEKSIRRFLKQDEVPEFIVRRFVIALPQEEEYPTPEMSELEDFYLENYGGVS